MRPLSIFGAIAMVVVGAQLAHGEPTPPLALGDIITVAVRQSPDFARARLDLEVARAEVDRADGVEDFHLGAVATYQHAPNQFVAVTDTLEIAGINVSIGRALPTGGTLTLVAGSQRVQQSSQSDPMNPAVNSTGFASSLSLSLNQPLLRGFGPGAFEAPIRQAEHKHDAALLLREAKARDDVVAIVEAYWQVALARRALDVRKASLALAQKQLEYTQGAIRADKLARSEELSVQEVIAVREQDALDAEQQVWDRSLALRQLAGLEIGPDAIGVETSALPAVVPNEVDLRTVVSGAFDHSAELAALEANERAAQAGVDAADGAARSRLDLSASAGPVGIAGGFHQSLTNAIDHQGYSVTASLTFDHAIQGRAERGGQAEARAVLQQARVDGRDARAKVATRATRSVQRARAALAGIALGDKAIKLAEANIEAEQHRLELGKSTTIEVLRRQDDLQQAKLRYATSVVDYLTARAELDGMTGAILAHYGIVMR